MGTHWTTKTTSRREPTGCEMPNLIDVRTVSETFATLMIGEPRSHLALAVLPLFSVPTIEPDWLTLTDAGDAMIINEVSEAGSVPSVKVENGADQPVLLLDGEELLGAKQNRVLNTTVLVAAHASVIIPVSCVERGRWAYRGHRFVAGGVTLFASLRQKKAGDVSVSLREHGVHQAGQYAIWHGIGAKAARHRVASVTGAMHAVYERYASKVDDAVLALAAQPGQVGVLVYLAGEWVGLELLAAPGLFTRVWPRLCAGYVADALGVEGGKDIVDAAADVLRLVTATPVEPSPAVGLGHEYRLTGPSVSGAALLFDNMIAHLMAFPVTRGRNLL